MNYEKTCSCLKNFKPVKKSVKLLPSGFIKIWVFHALRKTVLFFKFDYFSMA